MLDALRIRDLGVIRDVAVEFGAGLNVVTGETGAGKTMVVSGLNLLFGGRADASRIRTGADAASVEGRLHVDSGSAPAARALDAGGAVEDGELVLRRSLTTAGRSRAQVGGTSSPVAVLADIGDDFVAVHGQSDQMRLSRPGAQRHALDRFAGVDTDAYRAAFDAWRAADAQLQARLRDRGMLVRESDLLAHGLAEIEAAAPLPGEDTELAELATRLAAADDLRLAARTAHDVLLGDVEDPTSDTVDIRSLLTTAQRRLEQSAEADPALRALTERMNELIVAADDLGAELAGYAEGIDADPARLARAEARRAELSSLIRKYADPGTGAQGVLDWADTARDRLGEIDTSEEALAELTASRDRAEAWAAERARALSSTRHAAATRLARAVTDELHGLAMSGARLHVTVRPRVAITGSPSLPWAPKGPRAGAGPDGVDDVEFQLQPHLDSEPIALHKGASGGELSRVMLALEVVLAGTNPVPVMVFDEVDAGVGGRAAIEVGARLARLGRAHQVIVVTHLAQVAAFADRHLAVRGVTTGEAASSRATTSGVTTGDMTVNDAIALTVDPTVSEVVTVTGEDRVVELARMLAGRDTETAREHAAELLADAARMSAAPPTGAKTAPSVARPVRSRAAPPQGRKKPAKRGAEHS